MGHDKVRKIIEQVTKSLTPNQIEVLAKDDETLTLRVVSQKFDHMPFTDRFQLLSDLFEKEGTEIAQKYSLIFEAWTPAESEAKGSTGSEHDETQYTPKMKRSAKEAAT